MFSIDFWIGFTFGAIFVVGISFSVAIWFIIQSANFHDSWLPKKDKE